MVHQILETEQKALEINLNDKIYGTFAEIGAGQEVARYFFKVGAAAGTIAKTMSAYDKVFSDKIYGTEQTGRYVCENRLYKMLDHEYELMVDRLQGERLGTNFFVFADTVAAINYTKTIKGDGWLGLRFQLNSDEEPNDMILHVRMFDNDNTLQQQAVGILGVNMLYACYYYYEEPEKLLNSLMDNLSGRIAIDMVRLNGPSFEEVDNRLLSLWLVKNGHSTISMFSPDKRPIQASEFLYKKDILVFRGSFRPPTLVNYDMIKSSWEQFKNELDESSRGSHLICEITIDNLKSTAALDEKDFLDRADLLCALGQTVVISKNEQYSNLINYFADHKIRKIGIVFGAQPLITLMNDFYYNNQSGSLLAAFGQLFTKNVKVYVYPAKLEGSGEIMSLDMGLVPEGMKFLIQHLKDSNQIGIVKNFNPDILHIFSIKVLEMIQNDEPGWNKLVPPKVAKTIRENQLLGFPSQKIEFEY